MLEKITDKKFEAGKELTNEQAQSIFGGKVYATILTTGGRRYRDSWNDGNGNGRPDKGDTLTIYVRSISAASAIEEPVLMTDEDLKSGAEIIWEK